MAEPVPPFHPEKPRFDQSTYMGRLKHFLQMVDPRTLLTSNAELQSSVKLLEQYKANQLPTGTTDEQLWNARRIKEAVIHPVTGEEMFLPGRMSAFVPVNTIPTAGMVLAQTPPTMLFWHWINQTVNVMCNYVNRSGASVDTTQIAQAYGLAVGTSCGIAVGASELMKRAPPSIKRFGVAVPYLAVVSAGAANVAFTRMPEMQNGVPVMAPDGTALGTSKAAAFESVKLTVLSRNVCLPIMPLLVPPVLLGMIRSNMGIMQRIKAVAVVTEVSVVAACIGIGLPLAIAIFPQEMKLSTSKLEPQFQGLVDANGKPIDYVLCNKGL